MVVGALVPGTLDGTVYRVGVSVLYDIYPGMISFFLQLAECLFSVCSAKGVVLGSAPGQIRTWDL